MSLVKNYIISFFLLWIFLAPSVVKVLHKHEHVFQCTAKNEKHFHVHQEQCPICAFQFSLFTQQHKNYKIFIKEVFYELVCSYKSVFIKIPYYLSLQLRGPPVTNDLVSNIHFKSLFYNNKS